MPPEARRGASGGGLLVYGAGAQQRPLIEAGRRLGLRVIAVDRNPDAPGARDADRFVHASLVDHAAIEHAVAAEALVGVVVRATDPAALASAHRLARDRGLVHAEPTLVEASTRKGALAEAMAGTGVALPRRLEPGGAFDRPRAAVIVRPDVTIRGKAGIHRVSSPRALADALDAAADASANRRVDLAEWLPGSDVTALVQLDRGRARRLALLDEWVALRPDGRIAGIGVGAPSIHADAPAPIDRVLRAVAERFAGSRGLVMVSLRMPPGGAPRLIEIHLGLGGDAIAERLLPAALPGFDAFALAVASQTGAPIIPLPRAGRPAALVRSDAGWQLVEAPDPVALRRAVRARIPADWEPPAGLVEPAATGNRNARDRNVDGPARDASEAVGSGRSTGAPSAT